MKSALGKLHGVHAWMSTSTSYDCDPLLVVLEGVTLGRASHCVKTSLHHAEPNGNIELFSGFRVLTSLLPCFKVKVKGRGQAH